MPAKLSRREALLGSAAALTLPGNVICLPKKKPLRVVHLTDFHIQPELRAVEGSHAAFAHAMNLKPRPDLVLSGGDHIMDAFAQTEARTRLQWDLFDKLRKDHRDVRLEAALGNHDVWGWDKKDSATDGSERLWGKKWFSEFFGRTRTYASFDQGAWHFVILDNILLTPDGYNGVVDSEQVEWLKSDLAATKKPTLILSHIPLLSVTSLVGSYDAKVGDWIVGGNIMTKNLDELQVIFRQNPHVKLALSGHTHEVDRVDYQGVTYLCGGAVSGNWWNGPLGTFKPGYRLIDLHEDGHFEDRFLEWGWKP